MSTTPKPNLESKEILKPRKLRNMSMVLEMTIMLKL